MLFVVLAVVVGGLVLKWMWTEPRESRELATTIDHGLWDALLTAHVDDSGRVDYAAMARDERLDQYLDRLKSTRAEGLSDADARLAFWINAYNALTVRAVLDTLPAAPSKWPEYKISEQKVDGKSLWKGRRFDVGGERRTLDEIEHEILRKRDGLRDPRMHAALVCAARGCPHLWNRAYMGGKVRDQLADAMRRFANDPGQVRWGAATKTLHVSKILDWYGSDFTNSKFSPHAESIGKFLAEHVEDEALAERLRAFDGAMQFNEYDWRLNIQPTSATAGGD